ncbi:MAG TPA: hypothetical protein DEF12_06985 [Rhodobacteraceae bacterium]|jgi:hypothetical protein|nr:hypothetical protein [Paracoccaceae bacterium]HBV54769.1 hypothetical protein [Paracoccaceae bacterium]
MTSEISLQIIGVIRFSVLTDDFTPLNYGDAQTMRQRFFDPHRLEERLTMFEHLCLSTLARQTDKGFRCAILTAEDMPDWAMNRLKAMLAPHPQFLLYAAPMGHHYALIKDAYRATAAPGFTHRVSFRLDDDDGMALDYIARLRALSLKLLEISRDPFIVAYNRGYYLDRSTPGQNTLLDSVERAPLSAGTALIHPDELETNPYRYNHRAFAQYYNTYSEIEDGMFLRTIHPDNISGADKQGLTGRKKAERVAREVVDRFGIDLELLRTL